MKIAIPNLNITLRVIYGKALESYKHRVYHDLKSSLLVCMLLQFPFLGVASILALLSLESIRYLIIRTGALVLSFARVITFQGTSWRRSVFIALCLTTSPQSSLPSLSPTLVGMHLPTSTA